MTVLLHALRQPAVWLLVLCAGLSLLLGREAALRDAAEARSRALLQAYADLARRSGPAVPPPAALARR